MSQTRASYTTREWNEKKLSRSENVSIDFLLNRPSLLLLNTQFYELYVHWHFTLMSRVSFFPIDKGNSVSDSFTLMSVMWWNLFVLTSFNTHCSRPDQLTKAQNECATFESITFMFPAYYYLYSILILIKIQFIITDSKSVKLGSIEVFCFYIWH